MRFKRLYLGVGSTIIGLFTILMLLGLQITSPDGDFECTGDYRTEQECNSLNLVFGRECGPCTSRVNIYNPTVKNIFVYNKEEFQIGFSPNILDSAFYVKDGRCSGKLTGSSCSCYLKDGSEYAIKGWRCVDFTNRTKPRKDRIYVFRWGAYDTRQHLLIGFKESPKDQIKWGMGIKDLDYLDPIWQGVKRKFDMSRLTDCANELITTETIISPGNVIVTTKLVCERKGIVYLDNKTFINDTNFFCGINLADGVVECDSKFDGDGDGVCRRGGGETCYVYKFKSDGTYFLRRSNSEKYKIPNKNEVTDSFKKVNKENKEVGVVCER